MRKNGYWGTNWKRLDFLNLMKLNINIYFIRSWRDRISNWSSSKYELNKYLPLIIDAYYEGIQSHDKNDDI